MKLYKTKENGGNEKNYGYYTGIQFGINDGSRTMV